MSKKRNYECVASPAELTIPPEVTEVSILPEDVADHPDKRLNVIVQSRTTPLKIDMSNVGNNEDGSLGGYVHVINQGSSSVTVVGGLNDDTIEGCDVEVRLTKSGMDTIKGLHPLSQIWFDNDQLVGTAEWVRINVWKITTSLFTYYLARQGNNLIAFHPLAEAGSAVYFPNFLNGQADITLPDWESDDPLITNPLIGCSISELGVPVVVLSPEENSYVADNGQVAVYAARGSTVTLSNDPIDTNVFHGSNEGDTVLGSFSLANTKEGNDKVSGAGFIFTGEGDDEVTVTSGLTYVDLGPGADQATIATDQLVMIRGGSCADRLTFMRNNGGATYVADFNLEEDRINLEHFPEIAGITDIPMAEADGNTEIILPDGTMIMLMGIDPAELRPEHFGFTMATSTTLSQYTTTYRTTPSSTYSFAPTTSTSLAPTTTIYVPTPTPTPTPTSKPYTISATSMLWTATSILSSVTTATMPYATSTALTTPTPTPMPTATPTPTIPEAEESTITPLLMGIIGAAAFSLTFFIVGVVCLCHHRQQRKERIREIEMEIVHGIYPPATSLQVEGYEQVSTIELVERGSIELN